MKKHIAINILVGLLIGFVTNIIGIILYLLIFSKFSLDTSIEVAREQGVLGNVIALGALLNLLPFFLFLKKKRYYRARGVLLATLLAAIGILFLQFS